MKRGNAFSVEHVGSECCYSFFALNKHNHDDKILLTNRKEETQGRI